MRQIVVLGQAASSAAKLLRGKQQGDVRPNIDTGDFVVIVNAEKIVAHRQQAAGQDGIYRHSGYPVASSARPSVCCSSVTPSESSRTRSRACCPRIAWAARCLRKLKVYAGPTHPHAAQQPPRTKLLS